MNRSFDYTIIEMIENATKNMKLQPLYLSGPPAGTIGQLTQENVLYDVFEDAASGFVAISGTSLVDNLNHIRYRLSVVESGGVGSSGTFLALSDTPSTYTGSTGKAVVVNATEDGLEFAAVSGSMSLPIEPKDVVSKNTTNLIGNGTFDTDTDWYMDVGWAITGGKLVGTAADSVAFTTPVELVRGLNYLISFDVEVTSGSVTLNFSGTTDTPITTTQSYSVELVAGYPTAGTLDTAYVEFGGTGFTGTIDNLTVVAVDNISLVEILNYKAESSGGTPGGSSTEIQFNDGGVFGGDTELTWDKVNKVLTIGSGGIPIAGGNRINFFGDGTTPPRWTMFSYNDTITSGVPGLTTVRGGGTKGSPTQTKAGMILSQWAGLGYDNTNTIVATQVKILLIADADWTTTSRPVRIEMYTTPSGSTTPALALTIKADGTIDIATGKTYNINGSPHTHGAGDPPATTAANDMQVGNGAGAWIKKTLAEIKTILGLGTAAYTASSDYAISAKGVTNGDTHNHVGGDGAVLYSDIVLPCHGLITAVPASSSYYGNPFYYGIGGSGYGFVFPRAGVLKNLYAKIYDTQSGTGSLVFTVTTTALGATALTKTVAAGGAAGTYSNTVNSVSVAAGDGVFIYISNNATVASSRVGPMSFEFEVATT